MIKTILIKEPAELPQYIQGFDEVCLLILPLLKQGQFHPPAIIDILMTPVVKSLGANATLITLGEPVDLIHTHKILSSSMQYQLWISIKRTQSTMFEDDLALPHYHFGALVHTKYRSSLKHTKTRLQYTYCPACDKTTKDYGGKKHTYNSYGTLISDVWRDIPTDPDDDLRPIIQRFADLFGVQTYKQLLVLDCRETVVSFYGSHVGKAAEGPPEYTVQPTLFHQDSQEDTHQNALILGDAFEELARLPDNSVDFAFADPPYNLKKNYNSYADDLSITEYFTWCDQWIGELARVLRPGRTCAILNIPLWAIRHFFYMETILTFQNWIVWDALSFPVRLIMPAHYAILCFSKGQSRPLPGLIDHTGDFSGPDISKTFHPLTPLAEWFCLRAQCVRTRQRKHMNDRGPLTDLWWDLHRLKHNSRRVDHPCQLPPQLMYRLISIFTEPEEVVLDCFNGSGTTTLSAHQLNRRYIGIEFSEKYYKIAESRHEEIRLGLNPFRKAKRKLTEKNSSVERMPEQQYKIPKKTLQLEVRRVAHLLDKLPTREEMLEHGTYPIQYYDDYFASWGEVCAAARHNGMSETRTSQPEKRSNATQLSMFE